MKKKSNLVDKMNSLRKSKAIPMPNKPSKWYNNWIIWSIALVVALTILIRVVPNPGSDTKPFSELAQNVKDQKIESINVYDDHFEAVLKEGNKKIQVIRDLSAHEDLPTLLTNAGVPKESLSNLKYENSNGGFKLSDALNVIYIILFVGMVVFIFTLTKQVGTGGGGPGGILGMGESKAKLVFGKKQDVSFADVAGADQALDELKEIVEFLKVPQKYTKLGARIPKGVLMIGAPGTGKTLMARAISGEAGVPFFFTSGSEFEEMLVGAGASRVRDLFGKAKKASPAIIFIDEIDAVGRRRGTVMSQGHSEQTLNEILVQMDGFDKNTNVIVIAATNRPDVLDPALLRPGRFDRRVTLEMPDIKARHAILQVHAKNKPLATDVDLEKIAKRTVGFSGADLENMMNEAAIIAAKENKNEINNKDIEEASSKVLMGPAKKEAHSPEQRKLVAYHEAGHAVVAYFSKMKYAVHKVSIVARGGTGGSTEFRPEDDDSILPKSKLQSQAATALGGRAGEEIILGDDITTGASSDIEKATEVARKMVTRFGMSSLGPQQFGQYEDSNYLGYAYNSSKEYSEKTAERIDQAVNMILEEALTQARDIIAKHKTSFLKLVDALLEKETVENDEFVKFMQE